MVVAVVVGGGGVASAKRDLQTELTPDWSGLIFGCCHASATKHAGELACPKLTWSPLDLVLSHKYNHPFIPCNMDPPAFKLPSRDPQVLHPLSPERVNGTRPRTARSVMASRNANATDPESTENPSPRLSPTRKANLFADYNPNGRALPSESIFGPGAMPTSPSLPELHAFRTHTRTNSDVQGLVKRFEHLDVRDRDAENAERRKKHEAELHRAQVAREEAESDSRRLREEVRRLKKENDDGHDRERKVAKRLDVVMVRVNDLYGKRDTNDRVG